MSGNGVYRTPDERFANLPDWPYEPKYRERPVVELAENAAVGPVVYDAVMSKTVAAAPPPPPSPLATVTGDGREIPPRRLDPADGDPLDKLQQVLQDAAGAVAPRESP